MKTRNTQPGLHKPSLLYSDHPAQVSPCDEEEEKVQVLLGTHPPGDPRSASTARPHRGRRESVAKTATWISR